MSFSSDVKIEISRIKPVDCCGYAELYGMLLFSRSFSNSDLFFYSEYEEVTHRCKSLIEQYYGVKPEKIIHNGNFALKTDIITIGKIYTDVLMTEYITDVFECDGCFDAFARGAFMVCGTISNPQKGFHAEYKTNNEVIAISLQSIFAARKFNSHITKRGNYHVVYFKGNEAISDLLALIGAHKKALEAIDCAMINDMRNQINRRNNCETANIGKTVDAVIKQVRAIENLQKSGKLATLPDELQKVASLRMANREMSLKELGELCGLTRSGVNHRLNKLIELSSRT